MRHGVVFQIWNPLKPVLGNGYWLTFRPCGGKTEIEAGIDRAAADVGYSEPPDRNPNINHHNKAVPHHNRNNETGNHDKADHNYNS